MARIRTIKPEFPQSESMGRVSRDARLCFILLWTLVDDAGRFRGSSRMLASLLYPYDDDAQGLIEGWLDELVDQRCIDRYAVGRESYFEVCNWLSHQKIDRPSRSKFPSNPETSRNLEKTREDSSGDQGSRIKDQGSRIEEQENEMDFQKRKDTDRSLVDLSNEILKKADEKSVFKPHLKPVEAVYDRNQIVEAFKAWAYAQPQPFPYKNPISSFLRVASKLIDEGVGEAPAERAGVSQQDIVHLLDNIALLSDSNVVFNTGQKLVVIRLANEYGAADTLAGFKDFYGKVEENSKPYAAKDFTEKGEQFIRTRRALAAKAAEQEAFMAEQAAAQAKAAQDEIAAQLAEEDSETAETEIL